MKSSREVCSIPCFSFSFLSERRESERRERFLIRSRKRGRQVAVVGIERSAILQVSSFLLFDSSPFSSLIKNVLTNGVSFIEKGSSSSQVFLFSVPIEMRFNMEMFIVLDKDRGWIKRLNISYSYIPLRNIVKNDFGIKTRTRISKVSF